MEEILIHTDGGCSGNPGPGGWAYVMRYGSRRREASGHESATTNNRMELTAVINALSFMSARKARAGTGQSRPAWLSAPIKVFTDSQYVRNGVTLWLRGWKMKGWKTADRKPVKNQDLWMELDALAQELNPQFFWVEGHAGDTENERCDELVRAATAEAKSGLPPENGLREPPASS